MKLARSSLSYGEDFDKGDCERLSFEDWPRRDQDADRSSSSSLHRRPSFSKEGLRKPSSSSSPYSRQLEDDRHLHRSIRGRYDHEGEYFDWRKGYDRYRDRGDRLMQASSLRVSYGSDRVHRSESFSGLRREFPKGFRSERDRSRRDGNGSSSWWRSRSWKELAAEVRKSPSDDSDSVGRRSHAASPDDHRGKVRSRDSSSGEQPGKTSAEVKPSRESACISEMEEGELEPDPKPEAEPVAEFSEDGKATTGLESENCKDGDPEHKNLPEEDLEKKKLSPDGEKLDVNDNDAIDKNGERKLMDVGIATDEVRDDQNVAVKEMDEDRREEGKVKDANGANEVEDKFCGQKQDVHEEDSLCSQFSSEKSDGKNEEQVVEEEAKKMMSSLSPLQEETLVENKEEFQCNKAKVEVEQKEQKHETGNEQGVEAGIRQECEAGTGIEVEQKEQNNIDLMTEPEDAVSLFDQNKEITCETDQEVVTLTLMRDHTKEKYKDKGKSIVFSLSTEDPVKDDDAMEGSSGRSFELVFLSDTDWAEKAHSSGTAVCHQEDKKLKIVPLDLSLSLPGGLLGHSLKHSKPTPETPSCARSIMSLPSSLRTNSDGFTTSISFASSLPVHNLSSSLTQNSLDNYDHLIGNRKESIPLLPSVLQNGNSSHSSLHPMNDQHQSKQNGRFLRSSFPRQMSPTNSHGSHDTRSQHCKDKGSLTRERSSSSSSLFRSEQRDGEQIVLNGSSVTEKIVSKIVAESLHLNGRMLQEMTDHSVAYLRETICEMLTNTDKSKLHVFQEALQKRSDITMDSLNNCPKVLLEILVAIKTSLPDFIQRTNNLSSSELVEIFLNLRCQNLSCRSLLPVDDCDCNVCIVKAGFCSACMCLVCSKFDNALNTCSWVGCDVCLHWCHTDCGLRDSHIRNGCIAVGEEGITEMQFYCVACGHPSEMFGFVKEVFRSCAKDWEAETLAKELQYVKRIFFACNDVWGKRLLDLADQMLLYLEEKVDHSEVVSRILSFLSDSSSNISSSPSLFAPKESSRNEVGRSKAISCANKEWSQSVVSEKACLLENTGFISSTDCDRVGRKVRNVQLHMNLEKKPVVDELERVVKFKQAEAKLYQERADVARKEAEGLKRIAIAKNSKIDEDYASQIEKLQVGEAEERRKQKLKELQAIERAHQKYCNMKMRMEAEIRDLLLKMEATIRNLNA